jgi:tetratricopeptide (TPR) repeat protein/TolB-like protein
VSSPRLVASLLSKDPAGRIPSAASIVAVLRKIAEDASPSRPGWLIRLTAARWRLAIGLIVLGLTVAGGSAAWRWGKNVSIKTAASSAESSATASTTSDPRESVAVLGFQDLSEQAAAHWLGPALTEMLTVELAAGGNVRVISSERTAHARQALSLLEKEGPERAYMESLHALVGAKLIVRGSYLPIGNPGHRRIRVDIQVLTLPAGDTVVSMAETGEEAEMFDLVTRAGSKLRSIIGSSPPTQEQRSQIRKLLPDGSDAIRLYTEALSRLRAYDLVGARDFLLRAQATEPSSVAVQSALSEVWALLGQDSRAREAALQAFQGRHALPQENQLAIEAHLYETGRQWERASDTYRSLLTLFPDNLDYGLKLADTLSMAGHGAEGLAVLGGLHERPAPQGKDPRIDLTEAIVAWRLSDFLRARKVAEITVTKGRNLGSWLMIARGLIYLGNLAGVRGRPEEGIELLRQAQDLALRAGDRWTAARVDANLADILLRQGDLDEAEQVERQALASAREIGTAVGIGAQLSSLGKIRRAKGDFQGARRLLEDALEWHRRIDYRMWEAWTEADRGPVLLALGDPAAAHRSLTESLTLSRSVSNSRGEVEALQGLAELKMREGDLEESVRLQESALPLLRRLRDPGLGAEALDFAAGLLRRTGDLALARHRRALAEGAARHAADRLVSCRLLGTGARFAFREGDLAASRSASEEQLHLARQMRARPLEVIALRELAHIAWAGGKAPQALDLLREARGIAEKGGDRLTVMEISVDLARADLESGDFDASLKLAQEAADWYHDRHFSAESLALAIAAEDLLRLQRFAEAREAAARARTLAPEADHELRLEIAPALARVQAAQGDSGKPLRDLGSAIAEAEQNGWVPAALEARLARGEILQKRGGATEGSEDLGRLQKDAEAKGFRWIAHRAAGLVASTDLGLNKPHWRAGAAHRDQRRPPERRYSLNPASTSSPT